MWKSDIRVKIEKQRKIINGQDQNIDIYIKCPKVYIKELRVKRSIYKIQLQLQF